MISGTQLLEVDLRSGSVTTLMESADLIAVGQLATISKSKADGEEPQHAHRYEKLAVRTTNRVLVFDPPGKQHAAYLLPDELRGRGSIELYELDAGRALVNVGRRLPDGIWREEILWIDASGTILRRTEVPQEEGYGNRRDEKTRRGRLRWPFRSRSYSPFCSRWSCL